jgi:hypothetical protein
MFRIVICLAGLLLLTPQSSLHAQLSALQRAGDHMRAWDYVTAIQLYRQLLTREDNAEAKIQLAECYRRINDTENAELLFGQVVKLPEAKPIHWLYYGMMLQANGKCTQARPWFERYAQEFPQESRAQNLARSCDQAKRLYAQNKDIYTVSRLPFFNSEQNDFAPSLYKDQILFASERPEPGPVKRTSMWTGTSFSKLYSVTFTPNGANPAQFRYGLPQKFSSHPQIKYNEASAVYAPDGKTVYLTINYVDTEDAGLSEDGLLRLGIYYAAVQPDGNWGPLQALPFQSPEFSVAQPSLTADGKQLFFASNIPGGEGGMDLYVSLWEDGHWGMPFNLGPRVNTAGNELFPTVDANGRLYFASDGHTGLGGLDLYYTTPAGRGEWSAPINLGYPVNSTRDDFGIAFGSDLSWGIFSSNRPGGAGGDDLYAFQRRMATVELLVADALSQRPLAGVSVLGDSTAGSYVTGSDGRVFIDLPLEDCRDFSLQKKDYVVDRQLACTRGARSGELIRRTLTLKKEERFSLQGMVFDMLDGLPADGALVLLTSNCDGKTDTFTTTADGRFRFDLRKNCCYSVKAMQDGYLADVSEGHCPRAATDAVLHTNLNLQPYRDAEGFVAAKPKATMPGAEEAFRYNDLSGLYELPDGTPVDAELDGGLIIRGGILFDGGTPMMPDKNEWAKSQSGAGYLLNIYYDLDAINLREESVYELEKLRQMLEANPDLMVEIAAHTDSRASADYNLQLSQRRADAVVKWLGANGVDKKRLRGKGYGESRPVNRCTDGVYCTEGEHRLNRRTELVIIGNGGVGR